MSKSRIAVLSLLAACFLVSTKVSAKLWFLPDWQSDTRSFNSNTSDDKGGGDKPDLIGKCGTYGLIESCGSPKVSTGAIQPAPGLTCQKGCKCPTSYQYTSSNCTGDREVGGTTCDGKYNQCNLKTCPTAAKCDYKCKTYSPMSHCSSVCIECEANPCPGYYDCGGSWQYCTGSTCSADSSKCSVYCESDYFPHNCKTDETCPGIQRGNYCSVPCVSTCTNTITASDCAAECKNTGSSSCTRDGTTYYASCGSSKCGSNQSCSAGSCIDNDPCANVTCGTDEACSNGTCVSTCTYTVTLQQCDTQCKYVTTTSCKRNGIIYYDQCGSSKCGSNQSCSSGSCVDNCTPLNDESSCSWGTKNCSDNCGGIRSCCKTAAEYCSDNGFRQQTCSATDIVTNCAADSSYKKCGNNPDCDVTPATPPANAACSSKNSCNICTAWDCNTGYNKQDNTCVPAHVHSYSCTAGYQETNQWGSNADIYPKVCSCGEIAGNTLCYKCRPQASESGCSAGTTTCDDGCGGTRQCCIQCTDSSDNPQPGMIYYSDGTISEFVCGNKTAVGIVAHVDGIQSFIFSLDEARKLWTTDSSLLTKTELCNASWSAVASMEREMNGLLNTRCLVSNPSTTYPAAAHCNSYKPVSSGKGSSGWFLPSFGQLKAASANYAAINEGLKKLNLPELTTENYSSSTQVNGYGTPPALGTTIFTNNLATGERKTNSKGYDELPVRCAYLFADNRTVTTTSPLPGVIYNSDGTFTKEFYPSKTPVGVVAYTYTSAGKTKGYVISFSQDITYWGGDGGNLSCLPDYTSSNPGTSDTNGAANTACILKDSAAHPAAEFCGNMKAASSGKGSSGWYLPGAGEIKNITPYFAIINQTLLSLSKSLLLDDEYWSSTEYQNKYSTTPDAYAIGAKSGYDQTYKKSSGFRVPARCFLAF